MKDFGMSVVQILTLVIGIIGLSDPNASVAVNLLASACLGIFVSTLKDHK